MSDPTPKSLGFPDKFRSWRPGQYQAIRNVVTCPQRFDGNSVPTGGGKTGIYIGAAVEELKPGQRGVILTATKGLQQQVMDDFGKALPIVNISGKANYECTGRAGWTCEDGHGGGCSLKGTEGCAYSKVYFRALTAPLVLTNFSFWMAVHRYGMGLGTFNHMYADEAHAAFDELSNAIQIRISEHEIVEMLELGFPDNTDDLKTWKIWAVATRVVADKKSKEMKSKILVSRDAKQSWVRDFHHFRNLVRKLATLATVRVTDWVVDEWEHGFQFDAIRPSRYAESWMFLGIPRVSLFSATIRERGLHMIGVKDNYTFMDYPSTFDPRGNPVIHVPTIPINHYMDDYSHAVWLMRCDQFIGRRLDRKGTWHTSSYQRRDKVMEGSDWGDRGRGYMMTNRKGDITAKVIEDFRDREPPTCMVSPSIETGYDLPDDDCRYQILGRVPWPDMRSKLMVARSQFDPQYGANIAMQRLVQAHGRGRRSDPDWCENLIPDNNISKFLKWNYKLAPQYFLDCYREENCLPPPMTKDYRR